MANSSNINDSFFQGHYKEVWRLLIPPGLSEAECDFVTDVADLQPGDRVLDLMSGYGRHTLELARRGFVLTAIDNLPDYVTEINNAALVGGLSVEAFAVGALEASLSHKYKAIICMGNSLAFFDKVDTLSLLKKLTAHLQPGGVFIINTWMIAEIALKHFHEKEWHRVGDYKYLLDYKFRFQPNRIESEHTLVAPDGTVEVINGIDYVLTLDELGDLLSQADLRLRDVFSTPKKRPFRLGDNRAYLVAEKLN